MKMRYALKVYYDGRGFYGSQVQPGKRTVEGELLGALEACGSRPTDFKASGRTDRGVSALGNVFAVTVDPELKVRALNSHLPRDMAVVGVREVPEDFHPRYEALGRVYKYFLPYEGHDMKAMRSVARLLEGEHSFQNFAVPDGKNPVRRLDSITMRRVGSSVILTFRGRSFLRQMVRRLVTALDMAGRGELTEAALQRYMEGEVSRKLPPVEPEGLILWEVRYPFQFEADGYTMTRLKGRVMARRRLLEREALLYREILRTEGFL